MVKIDSTYEGHFRCKLTHEPSGSTLLTDAPKDNMGQGAAFSPTDLIGAPLSSCILTTMAIVAKRENIDFVSAKAEVIKEMADRPRRISKLHVKIFLSQALPDSARAVLESAANACPVKKSLNPAIETPVEFLYSL